MEINKNAYRGQGRNVLALGNSASEILSASGLDWKTVGMPVFTHGRTKQVELKDWQALHRSDNGALLDVATKSYHPLQNAQIVSEFCDMADSVGMKVSRMGEIDGGTRFFGVADGEHAGVITPGGISEGRGPDFMRHCGVGTEVPDLITMEIVMGGGHKVGIATTIHCQASRKVCLNGARISEFNQKFRMTHRTKWSHKEAERLAGIVNEYLAQFKIYLNKAGDMRQTPADVNLARAYTLDVLQPDLLSSVIEQTLSGMRVGSHAARTPSMELSHEEKGKRFLSLLLEGQEQATRLLTGAIDREAGRHVLEVLAVQDSQPGAAMAGDSLWKRYNAVTYWVDHARGRSITQAMFGEGDKIKRTALDKAVEYTQTLRAIA